VITSLELQFTAYVKDAYSGQGPALCYSNGDQFGVQSDIRGLEFSDQLSNFNLVTTDWQPTSSNIPTSGGGQ
jgi:hypothetical protein